MRLLRSSFVTISLALVLVVGLSACGKKPQPPATGQSPAQQPSVDPKAMAVSVDGHVITWGDVINEMQRLQSSTAGQITAQQAADGLVMRQLLRQTAEKSTTKVTEQEIAAGMAEIRQQVPTNTTLEAVLRSRGIKENALRADIINTVKVNHLLKQIAQKVPRASDAEINQFVKENPKLLQVPESVGARVVLVATKAQEDAATRQSKKSRAESLRKQLLGGADFAKLAATASDDPSRTRGGLLPAIQRGVIPDKVFENAAFSQRTGELGPVLETRYGFVILQVQTHTPAKMLKLDEVKEKVRVFVTEQKFQRVLQDYLKDLRSKAKIVYAQSK